MERLIFCRDGVLRRHFHAYDRVEKARIITQIPLLAWQNAVDDNAFLKSLGSEICFEDGLTVGEMMRNLSPWADVMTGVACMDFPAFLEECANPYEGTGELSRIELTYTANLKSVPKFGPVEKRFEKKENGLFSFNIGKPMFTGKLEMETGWDYRAMLTEEGKAAYDGAEHVSLSFSPVSEYQHVPLHILTEAVLYDETSYGFDNRKFLGTSKAVTRTDHPNVKTEQIGTSRKSRHYVPIEAPTPKFYETLVCGFLWDMGFSYSPVQRDAQRDEIIASKEEVDALLEGREVEKQPDDNSDFRYEMEQMKKASLFAEENGLPMRDVQMILRD